MMRKGAFLLVVVVVVGILANAITQVFSRDKVGEYPFRHYRVVRIIVKLVVVMMMMMMLMMWMVVFAVRMTMMTFGRTMSVLVVVRVGVVLFVSVAIVRIGLVVHDPDDMS
jgi:hypothetical protein